MLACSQHSSSGCAISLEWPSRPTEALKAQTPEEGRPGRNDSRCAGITKVAAAAGLSALLVTTAACAGAGGGGGGGGGGSGGASSINVLMVNNPQMLALQKHIGEFDEGVRHQGELHRQAGE